MAGSEPDSGAAFELTREERSFVLRTRAIQVLQAFTHPISGTRSQLQYLDLCGHDTAVMEVHYGQRCRRLT